MLHADFDWKRPDYAKAFRQRMRFLDDLRAHPEDLRALKLHYASNYADFISDWGVTHEPRNAEKKLPTLIPFILFPKQREWVDWVVGHWRAGTPGLTEKSRDMGVSWLMMAVSCTMCLFNDGVAVGIGSRKTEYVDKIGTFKPLLPKARMFMEYLPPEFREGWAPTQAPFMRVGFPATGSLIAGEGGDDLGRGDRTSIFFVDEYAFFERPDLTEMSLSQTTNCRIDVSTPNSMNNPFAQKRWGGKVDVFIFDWRDDPRKDDEWYRLLPLPEDEGGKGLNEVTIAQEIDHSYTASVHGVVIPATWVKAAIDFDKHVGLDPPTGARGMSLDIADEGVDKNAACVTKGYMIESSQDWSGKGDDLFVTAERAFEICDEHGLSEFDYDADGVGASIRGDARVINQRRAHANQRRIAPIGYRGSEAVADPDKIVEGTIGREGDKGRTNADFFLNRKAQSWWELRRRFERVYRWRTKGVASKPDDIVVISSACPNHMRLVAELSQATFETNAVGKIVVKKTPQGQKSPNLADAAVIRFAPKGLRPIQWTPEMAAAVRRAGKRPRT
jgi:hypothetical protein